jgi:hypothetical protein
MRASFFIEQGYIFIWLLAGKRSGSVSDNMCESGAPAEPLITLSILSHSLIVIVMINIASNLQSQEHYNSLDPSIRTASDATMRQTTTPPRL